jgi:hypothetical protein
MYLVPSSLAQWFGAIATTAAVLVALFKDEVIKHFRRPILDARITQTPPDCLMIPMMVLNPSRELVWKGDSYWLRLWVQNKGKSRAENVQVFVARLFKKGASDKFILVPDFVPMNLRWANNQDAPRPVILADISPKPIGRHCDFCSISDPQTPLDLPEGLDTGSAFYATVAGKVRKWFRPTSAST